MDILILAFFAALGLACIGRDFYKKAPYMSVIGGIIFIFLGIFLSVDASITQSFCLYNTNTTAIECVDHALPTFSFSDKFNIALGGILMFAGAGVIVDMILRFGYGTQR